MSDTKRHIALWQQLQIVATVLQQVRAGVSATAALARVEPDLRPGVQALLYHVLRNLGWAGALRALLAPRPPAPVLDALLCASLALLAQDETASLYDPHTLVNQAVEAAKRNPRLRTQASFLNACLRRFVREQESLQAAIQDLPEAAWNHPRWWIERLQQDWPQAWREILSANRLRSPMSLRVNLRRVSQAGYLTQLRAAGMVAHAFGACGIALERPCAVTELPGFSQGLVSVQDEAAQIAAPLLLQDWTARQGLRVLDACAAPGGKTAHLLELADCDVLALESDPVRAVRIGETLQRLQLQATVRVTDAAQRELWWDGVAFDAILLDAPCSASGIVRRHPDIVWLRRPGDIAQLAAQQARLLRALWPTLKVGGRLLYCTCSVFRAEGVEQIQTFLAHNTEARLLPAPGHLLPGGAAKTPVVPDNRAGEHDGFYFALLEKGLA